MGAHLRNGRNISVEQQQQELQHQEREQQPDSRAGDEPSGLQQSNDQRYSFSPAAAERLQRLRLQSAINYRHRYETTGGRKFDVGSRNFTCLNQFEGNFLSAGHHVQQVDARTPSNRRQVFPVNSTTAMGRQILSPTPHQPSPSPFLATSPSPAPLGPEDIIVDNQDLETVINLLNKQWNTFVQARENQNPRLMRMALVQAASSQKEIRLLAGGAEMLRICKNWIAREEVADLDRAQATSQNRSQRLAITQTAHEHTLLSETTHYLHPRHRLLNPHRR
ncbi:uncharacterized protein PGTG_13753 [Puccinia graminis f. sp. tritici CRL 75-36-700-3]|uniref:Uncharacterized protein n=1 Tax=Puccinia graminis f. sp. tritici (strain CRL 75-36-700-3 / race SCCL) TaxID=418459 RepID=E3KUJ9_PUCGT|nr:uncharacterized protein PGTG_13753 [Puccinia graminis f. sp. tritici CRL 75-36-700-3]EFP87949.2 hypothetical protein PGTG_13753 [Puccinia graminis f. sp. tritici CRL 75-36-700-3]